MSWNPTGRNRSRAQQGPAGPLRGLLGPPGPVVLGQASRCSSGSISTSSQRAIAPADGLLRTYSAALRRCCSPVGDFGLAHGACSRVALREQSLAGVIRTRRPRFSADRRCCDLRGQPSAHPASTCAYGWMSSFRHSGEPANVTAGTGGRDTDLDARQRFLARLAFSMRALGFLHASYEQRRSRRRHPPVLWACTIKGDCRLCCFLTIRGALLGFFRRHQDNLVLQDGNCSSPARKQHRCCTATGHGT